MTHRHFARGRSTFVCTVCDHNTRDTTAPLDTNMCGICDELAMNQNSVWDGAGDAYTVKERERLISKMEKRGGNVEKVRKEFADLFNFKVAE